MQHALRKNEVVGLQISGAYGRQLRSTDRSNDTWIKCTKCFRWAYELCAGIEKHMWRTFKCDLCIRKS